MMITVVHRVLFLTLLCITGSTTAASVPSAAALDAQVELALKHTGAQGLAVAVVDKGRVTLVRSYGKRNAKGDPLEPHTVMYGASLTKPVFAFLVMQLVDEGKVALDRSIADYLSNPLPNYPADNRYGPWQDLRGDERWRLITPRASLTHTAGFANFAFVEPDGKLRIHFTPGARYAYSGEGLILLQFVLERGLGVDVGAEMQRRIFDRFGMKNTSMTWRADFAQNLADGWKADGEVEPHDERSKVRAAGSMDTTIEDFARFAAAFVTGEGLSRRGFSEMIKPQLAIRSATQFPTLAPEPAEQAHPGLAVGLGFVLSAGPQGRVFFKAGHNDSTGNMWVCLVDQQRCIVLMANDVRAEAAFPRLTRFVLGETGVAWRWEYGEMSFW
jgi:CubicO group peptidase (beta-lactamase class C family)